MMEDAITGIINEPAQCPGNQMVPFGSRTCSNKQAAAAETERGAIVNESALWRRNGKKAFPRLDPSPGLTWASPGCDMAIVHAPSRSQGEVGADKVGQSAGTPWWSEGPVQAARSGGTRGGLGGGSAWLPVPFTETVLGLIIPSCASSPSPAGPSSVSQCPLQVKEAKLQIQSSVELDIANMTLRESELWNFNTPLVGQCFTAGRAGRRYAEQMACQRSSL
ncbi:unnamed protein product [Pleuronectes platessa]|uniref:Uncharacterized protein n=1 Tax=Pleuronectes platessa TaxID=8262 RepID=A0A9N7UX46_PLEPL|nr:unnamed protein product [Pleuronectes platessa]